MDKEEIRRVSEHVQRPAGSEPIRAGASGFEPLEVASRMATWKKPPALDFVAGATERYS